MHILPYDYVADLPSNTVGLARTAALIRAARAEARNTLLFDNGDFLHGTPMGEELARAARGEDEPIAGPHPIIAAMIQLGYDAITLGNHDFDHGIGYLGAVLADAPFPVVSSNLSLRPAEPPLPDAVGGLVPVPLPAAVPFAILQRRVADRNGALHPLRIGLLGFLPPGSVTGLKGGPFRAETRDIVLAARSMVPHLRGLGADIVLALAHSGIGDDEAREGMENAVVPLADVDGIDAVVAGHAHQVFPDKPHIWSRHANPETGMVHGKPVVAPGFWGSHLGIIDLTLIHHADGRWSIDHARVEARPISVPDPATGKPHPRVLPDPAIVSMMGEMHDFTLDRVRRPVGATRRALHSYFAGVAPSPALDIVLRAKTRYVSERLAGTGLEHLPLVASTAPFKAGGIAGPGYYTHVPPGEITLRSLADLYLYPNDLMALRLSGAELGEWLERAASVYATVRPGETASHLLRPDAPIYCLEVLSGVDYEIDLGQPPRYPPKGLHPARGAHRVRAMRIGGEPVDDNDEVLLLTNSFRVNGGGDYPLLTREQLALDLPVPMRDVLIDYLATTGPYDQAPDETWRFAPLGGARVQFRSAPQAVEFLDEVGSRRIRPGGLDDHGFRLFSLEL